MTKDLKLVTIFSESVLERKILNDLEQLGIKGYTVSDCRGRGTHVSTNMIAAASPNIRIEIMCEHDVSLHVAGLLTEKYEKNFGLLIFSRPIDLLN
ncbi:hypothetical protein [Hydrogenophaga sp.]|uniref:P-II family nitrogen regulator n=1 Tax=Hydrogenophaga sp. TaxID=1904254 RepID=UPI00199C113C|nr:hypothetical protein [Hydrogenophaga sp.]MBD3892375.1 hypothetical protein [Hydrogenophaga sp.]